MTRESDIRRARIRSIQTNISAWHVVLQHAMLADVRKKPAAQALIWLEFNHKMLTSEIKDLLLEGDSDEHS